jgi:hypothetical protein
VARERQPAPGLGRRLRAAIIVAARNDEIAAKKVELARELNVSTRTLDRMVAEKRWPSDWEIGRLAELLDVPEGFLRSGFRPDPAEGDRSVATQLPTDLVSWLEALEEHVDQLRQWSVEDGARLARVERLLDADAEPPPVRHIGSRSDSRR